MYMYNPFKNVHYTSLARYFTTCNVMCNKYASREGRMMQKLLKGSLRKKKNWYIADKAECLRSIPTSSTFHQGSQNTKRIAVLNKLFMRNITDLMATGEVASEVLGHGISISRVKVAPDFSVVRVYWLARGTESDIKVEQILSGAGHSLHHELSQLRVMGVVPKIEFVKDKQQAIVIEVDRLLAKADFGEDFVPQDPTSYLRSEFTFTTSLPPDIQDNIKQLESKSPNDDDEPLPPMRMDVLGLDHADIMNKVLKSVKKSAALHRQASVLEIKPLETEEKQSDGKILQLNANEQKYNVAIFIQKRRIMKQKMLRGHKNYQPDRELLESNVTEEGNFMDDWNEREENDYIEEFDDVHKVQ